MRAYVGDQVLVSTGGEQVRGVVVDVMERDNVKVLTDDGLALWYVRERITFE